MNMKPMYVLQRQDDGRYADFLHKDLNRPLDWSWCDTLQQARWLLVEGLPEMFYENSLPGRARRIRPQIEVLHIPEPPACYAPAPALTEAAAFPRLIIKRIEVHPGYYPT